MASDTSAHSVPSKIPVRRQMRGKPDAPSDGMEHLQINKIYGFGTTAPDYLLYDKSEIAHIKKSSSNGPASAGVTGAAGLPSNRCRSVLGLFEDAVTTPQLRRVQSVSVLPKPEWDFSPALSTRSLNTVQSKRTSFNSIPGGEPFQFHYDDISVKDPLTIQPVKAGDYGGVRLLNGDRRLRRPTLSFNLSTSNSDGTSDALRWA